nr:MAG TPA: hypothetical protein [Caudoviricetes sp.]
MKHSKLIGLQAPLERMVRLAGAAYDAATAPQTAPSGSISVDNSDGTRTVIGPASGDGTMATHVGDTTPPGRPLGIAGASSAGVVYVAWGGKLDGGIPADFDHVSLYMTVSGVDQLVGTLTKAGIVSTIPMQTTATVEVWATAEDDACLADGTAAHNISGTSDRATVTVTQAADSAAVLKLQEGITQAVNDAATAKSDAAEAIAETKDLVTLRIDSSRGTVFKNSEVSTVLTVRCWKRGQELTTLSALRQAMLDATARIRWYVLREGDADWVSLADSDSMLSDDGFTLTVKPSDVDVKCTFKAEVVTD